MERIFYKPAMRTSSSFQVFIPKEIAKGLEIEDRDELKITIEKTGRKILKTTRFKKKEVAETSAEENANP